MFLIGHSAIGIIASSWTANPLVAFAVGFASHFVVDAVPHGDEDLGPWAKRGEEILRLTLLMALDLSVLAFAYALVLQHVGWQWSQLAAVAGACAPDFMWGLEKLVGRRLFGPFGDWHKRNHNRWQVRMAAWYGIPLQLVVTVGLWLLVMLV